MKYKLFLAESTESSRSNSDPVSESINLKTDSTDFILPPSQFLMWIHFFFASHFFFFACRRFYLISRGNRRRRKLNIPAAVDRHRQAWLVRWHEKGVITPFQTIAVWVTNEALEHFRIAFEQVNVFENACNLPIFIQYSKSSIFSSFVSARFHLFYFIH